jgi:hypothetical protein
MEDMMKTMFMVGVFATFAIGLSGMFANDYLLFAEYPPQPRGCCKQRDWLAGQWRKTQLNYNECEQLNRNRDSLDNLFEEKGYVWWDTRCNN